MAFPSFEHEFLRGGVRISGVKANLSAAHIARRHAVAASRRGGSGSQDDLDDPPLWGQGRPPPPMGSRGSNTENQRNDLIRHDCETIASPGRTVTICIHDYRPRRA